MANIFLIVEGSTEEQFYKRQLQEQYVTPDGTYQHYLQVVQMPSKKNIYARTHKGGRITYQACVNNIRRFIAGAGHCDLIMLILDYYGLDPSFSSHLTATHRTLDQKVKAIQERLEGEIDHPKFRFRLQVHEFETYLFSDPEKVARHFQKPETQEQIESILANFENNPELINDNLKTAPSKRLETLFPGFGKTTDVLTIARQIGVPAIRKKCSRFDEMCVLIDDL